MRPKPTPPGVKPLAAMEKSWGETVDFVIESGGIVVAADVVRHEAVIADTDGNVVSLNLDPDVSAPDSLISSLKEMFDEVDAERIIALCWPYSNWDQTSLGVASATRPNVVLPIRVAPIDLLRVISERRGEQYELRRQELHIDIATDASVHIERFGGVSWAWVDTEGEFRLFRSGRKMTSNTAELMAIFSAIESRKPEVSVRVYSDSLWAVRLVNAIISKKISGDEVRAKAGIPSGARWLHKKLTWALRELPLRHVEVVWVRGHNGNPLNEAANRLARLARISAAADAPPEAVKHMCAGVVADLRQELEAERKKEL